MVALLEIHDSCGGEIDCKHIRRVKLSMRNEEGISGFDNG
jgi:hypothetical protein